LHGKRRAEGQERRVIRETGVESLVGRLQHQDGVKIPNWGWRGEGEKEGTVKRCVNTQDATWESI